jgi:cytochrome c556
MAGVGYHEALAKSKRSPATLVLVLSYLIVITLVVDLDRPREGLIKVNQEAMTSLQSMIEGAKAFDAK